MVLTGASGVGFNFLRVMNRVREDTGGQAGMETLRHWVTGSIIAKNGITCSSLETFGDDQEERI